MGTRLTTGAPVSAVGTRGGGPRPRGRALAGLAGAAALVLAACGGDDGGEGASIADLAEGVDDGADEGASGAQGEIEPAAVALDASVRYAGFVYHLGDGELGPSEDWDGNPDPTVGRLTIDAQIENLGEHDEMPDSSALHLERDGAALDADFFGSELPVVPGGARSHAKIVADYLPADLTLEDTTLVFGGGAVHQARVPLEGTGEVISPDPLEITPGQPGKVGEATVTVTGGELRYDDLDRHGQYDADKALLLVEFDMAASAAINEFAGSTYAGAPGSDIQLGLPDGTRVAYEPLPDTDTWVELEPSETKSGLRIAFVVDSDVRGSFELAVKGAYGLDRFDEVAGFAPFELTD